MIHPCPNCDSRTLRLYVVNSAMQYVTVWPDLFGNMNYNIRHEEVTETVVREATCQECNHVWTE